MTGDIYSADAHCWSGLLSGDKWQWQEGLRHVCAQIGGVQFHSSMLGFEGWEEVAAAALRRKARSLLLMGHSNGGYAITSIAAALESAGIECWLISFDRTLKTCPALGGNVAHALDLWAGLENLKIGPRFKGTLTRRDFSEESHIGVIGNGDAQRLAIDFGKRWKRERRT